jgi:NADP-dependent 3-hydroxy acid dehydrogenase YdfG
MSTAQTTERVAVITGASSGIGEATARALAADGHRIALLARRADRIQALASELGNGAIAIEADVTDRGSIVAAAERLRKEPGDADVLVNNAGVMLTAPFTSHQREEHRRMVETNLLGAMTVTDVFLDQLRAGDGGDLVNISSVAGRVAPAGFAAYSATKSAISTAGPKPYASSCNPTSGSLSSNRARSPRNSPTTSPRATARGPPRSSWTARSPRATSPTSSPSPSADRSA